MGWDFWTDISKVMTLNTQISLNHSCRDLDYIGIPYYLVTLHYLDLMCGEKEAPQISS